MPNEIIIWRKSRESETNLEVPSNAQIAVPGWPVGESMSWPVARPGGCDAVAGCWFGREWDGRRRWIFFFLNLSEVNRDTMDRTASRSGTSIEYRRRHQRLLMARAGGPFYQWRVGSRFRATSLLASISGSAPSKLGSRSSPSAAAVLGEMMEVPVKDTGKAASGSSPVLHRRIWRLRQRRRLRQQSKLAMGIWKIFWLSTGTGIIWGRRGWLAPLPVGSQTLIIGRAAEPSHGGRAITRGSGSCGWAWPQN
jgi:hypothetical protein